MKAKCSRLFLLLAVLIPSIFSSPVSNVFAQGALTPPGPPAPTMKSLDQVEARTAITNTSSLVTISLPGSYYLTHNLAVTSGDGIDIATGNVSLDLNGFTISSTASNASGVAIYLTAPGGASDVSIFNGHIKGGVTNNNGVFNGPGFANGIFWNFGLVYPLNVSVSQVSVSGCGLGTFGGGIILPINNGASSPSYGNRADSCSVRTIGGTGIQADTVTRCTAHECLSSGIVCVTVSDSRGDSVGTNGLISGISANTANNCFGYAVTGNGINAGSTATSCYGYCSNGYGIVAFIANACHGTVGAGTAILATHNVNSF